MAEWQKVFPSGADKIYMTQVDADSPTGFGLVEKTLAQMKTLLGLPVGVYIAKITQSFTADPVVTEIFNNLGYTPYTSFERTSSGLYTWLFNSNLSSYVENKTLDISIEPYDSVYLGTAETRFYYSGNTGKFETLLKSDFSTNADKLAHILTIRIWS